MGDCEGCSKVAIKDPLYDYFAADLPTCCSPLRSKPRCSWYRKTSWPIKEKKYLSWVGGG